MSLNIKSVGACSSVHISARPTTSAKSAVITITSLGSASVGGSTTHNITYGGQTTQLLIPVTSLSASTGAFMITLSENNKIVHTKALIIHCDLDCCLTKLTNELVACNCDCPKCSSALAKAQKVFLLLQSAQSTVVEINSYGQAISINSGKFKDISEKYTKAKEICDNSCGCDC